MREMSKIKNKKSSGTTPSLAEGLPGGQVLLLEATLCAWHCLLSWRLLPMSVLGEPSPHGCVL